MYEIFGSEEVVSVRKNTNNKQFGVSGSFKGDLNQKKRSISLGSSKKVLGDVSNKVKNAQSHLRVFSPSKSSKKSLFPEESNVHEELKKNCLAQSVTRSKSPTNMTPMSLKSNNGLAKCIVQSVKRSKSPNNLTPISLKSNLGVAKIPIFVESDTENETDIDNETGLFSDQSEDVFVSPDVCGSSNFADTPQAMHGYCSGYDTPEEDADGWLIEPLWNNINDLARMTNLHRSLESVKDLSDNEELCLQNYLLDENLLVDDACIIPQPCDVPIPDMEW